MGDLLDQLARHVHDALGVNLAHAPWAGDGRLPPFLEDRYDFYEARLLDMPCLLMVDKGQREEPPAAIRKHYEQIRSRCHESVIYVRQRVTAYNRKRLIEQKVPFVVPGNQMYLPMLGIDLREHFRNVQTDRTRFRPSSQAVLIHMLLREEDSFGPTDLAPALGYSAMTISRALDELEAAELAAPRSAGRERRLHLNASKSAVWQNAQPHLRDPVQGRHWVRPAKRGKLPGPRAGLTALAHYSMLAEPENRVVAVSREDWQSFLHHETLRAAAADEPDAVHVEVWSYPPTLFAADGLVDRLSLYLSLRETDDERIEAAIEQMMENVSW